MTYFTIIFSFSVSDNSQSVITHHYLQYTHYVRRLEIYAKCESPLSFSYFSYEDRYNAARGKWQTYTAGACKKLTKVR